MSNKIYFSLYSTAQNVTTITGLASCQTVSMAAIRHVVENLLCSKQQNYVIFGERASMRVEDCMYSNKPLRHICVELCCYPRSRVATSKMSRGLEGAGSGWSR